MGLCKYCKKREAICGNAATPEYCSECSYFFQAVPGLSDYEERKRNKIRTKLLQQLDLSKI